MFIAVLLYRIAEKMVPSENNNEFLCAKWLAAVWPLSIVVLCFISIVLLFNLVLKKAIK